MRKSVKVSVASAGLLLIGSPAAAQGDMSTFGNLGVANGADPDPAQLLRQRNQPPCSAVASCTNAYPTATNGATDDSRSGGFSGDGFNSGGSYGGGSYGGGALRHEPQRHV